MLTAQLIEYAEHEFALNKRQKDGASLRDHLEIVHRQTGKTPPQLEPVDIPYGIQYLWGFFCDISGGRGYSEAGAMPLSYSEILAWSQLTKSDPTAWEISVLKSIDRAFLTESNKK